MILRYYFLKVKYFLGGRRVRPSKIKALIKTCGLTQKELAENIDFTPEYLNNIIYNRNNAKLNPQKVPALAELLGVSPDEISRLFALPKPHIKCGGERI